MRAMRRARISSAALRAGSSSWSHGLGVWLDAGVGAGSGACGLDGSRNAKFNCMAALLLHGRLGEPAQESVNDGACLKQIGKTAETVQIRMVVSRRWLSAVAVLVPVGPRRRNKRAAAVRQDSENEKNAAPPDAADHGQCPVLEGMAFAGDDHRLRRIAPVMGSLSLLPLIR